MTDTQGNESAQGAERSPGATGFGARRDTVNRGVVNRGAVHRGAVTTADRARHILHTQLEADFCQAPGSISRALEELRDYPEAAARHRAASLREDGCRTPPQR